MVNTKVIKVKNYRNLLSNFVVGIKFVLRYLSSTDGGPAVSYSKYGAGQVLVILYKFIILLTVT